MKYIKLFEGLIPSDSKYYTQISYNEKEILLGKDPDSCSAVWTKEVPVSQEVINNLIKLGYDVSHFPAKYLTYSPNATEKYKSIFIRYGGDKFSPNRVGAFKRPKTSVGDIIRVYEVMDEWFILEIDDRYNTKHNGFYYYKCDQFDGLLKCLEDNEIFPYKV